MDAILELKDLVVQFHTMDGIVHAVNGVSYAVAAGKTLGVVGESGCGKSVSVLSIMRLIPDPPGKIKAGQILYRGQNLLEFSKQKMESIRGSEIAMVFQDPMTSLNPVLSIGRQLCEAMILHEDLSKAEARNRAVELLTLVGIPHPADRLRDYPHQFSGGMRQRVMIAMALACKPSVLIADEPTTALDVTIQAQIIELTRNLQDQFGMAVIWITHDLGVVAELADEVVVMYAGHIVEQANVYQIYENPRHPYTQSLLKSLPRVDSKQHDQRLATIPGFPPGGLTLMPGCPFAPRCSFAVEHCRQHNPHLEQVEPDHQIACWVDITSGRLR